MRPSRIRLGGAAQPSIGQAFELSLAFVTTYDKSVLIGQVLSTESAQAAVSSYSVGVAQAIEVNTSLQAAAEISVLVGQPVEISTATAVTAIGSVIVGQSQEVDASTTVGLARSYYIGQSIETDTAGAVTATTAGAVAQVLENNIALSAQPAKTITLSAQANEFDTAFSVGTGRSYGVQLALSTNSAQKLNNAIVYQVGYSTETDTATAVSTAAKSILTAQDKIDIASEAATAVWEHPKTTLTPGTWGHFVGTRLLTFLNFLGHK